MNQVFVLDTKLRPQPMINPATARQLLSNKLAAVYRRNPFTIVLKCEMPSCETSSEVRIDPGSKFTGLAIVSGDKVIWAANLEHRCGAIKNNLESRRSLRRGRRARSTRYRAPRFLSCENNMQLPELI